MEAAPLTLSAVSWIVSLAAAAAAVVLWFEKRLAVLEDAAAARVAELNKELHSYKLDVVNTYASVQHLKEVEQRLERAIAGVTERLDTLPARLASELRRARPPR